MKRGEGPRLSWVVGDQQYLCAARHSGPAAQSACLLAFTLSRPHVRSISAPPADRPAALPCYLPSHSCPPLQFFFPRLSSARLRLVCQCQGRPRLGRGLSVVVELLSVFSYCSSSISWDKDQRQDSGAASCRSQTQSRAAPCRAVPTKTGSNLPKGRRRIKENAAIGETPLKGRPPQGRSCQR